MSTGAEEAAGMFLFLLLLAAILIDAFEHFAHILDLLEERRGDIQRFLLGGSQGEAIAGTGIDFHELASKLVLLLKNQPREVSRVPEFGNDGALHRDVEALEHAVHQVVRERPFLRGIPQKHADNRAHVVLNLDHENLFIVSHEDGAAAIRRENSANFNGHDVILHVFSLWPACENTSRARTIAALREIAKNRAAPGYFQFWNPAQMCFVAGVDNYNWPKDFREIFEDGLDAYRLGKRNAESMFGSAPRVFFDAIGATPQEIFDFVEDTFYGGEPGFETTLLITVVRREYFLGVQKGMRSQRVIDMDSLPAKSAQLGGIEWLPRIIEKARAKLRGEMPADLMYGCGGDRAFLREHGIHAADFLREVWAAGDDAQRILEFVRKSAADRPPDLPPAFCEILPGGRVKC